MNDYTSYPKLADFKKLIQTNVMIAGLAKQIDLLVERYGIEYLEVAESVLKMVSDLGYDSEFICKQYIFDYLMQMRIFLKSGNYGHDDFQKIRETIYNNRDVMLDTYMPGLLLAYSNTTILYTKYHLFRNVFLPLLSSDSTGLEVGFGEGFYLWELHKRIPGIKLCGVDISEHAVEFADRLLKKAKVGDANLSVGNISEGLNFSSQCWDYGILAEVIEHVDNPRRAVRELGRVIKQGGHMFLSTVKDSNHMDHITNFTSSDEVENLVINEGFRLVDRSIYCIRDDFPDSKDISVGMAFVWEKV